MRITKIKATGIEMTDAIRNHVEEKLGSLTEILERFGEIDIDVEVGKTTAHHRKGDVFRCEMQAEFPGKKLIRVEKVEDDLYKAVIAARDVFAREVKEYKESL